MELNVYTIYDTAAKAYNTPFFMQNHGLATRAFSDQVNSKQENQIANHPEQFILFHIGSYDDQTGLFNQLDISQALGKGIDFKEQSTDVTELSTLINDFRELIKSTKGN